MREHAIISLSVEKELLERIEKERQEHGFSGRSDFWRKAAMRYIDELDEGKLQGRVRGALFILHDEEKDDVLHELKHSRLVTTQLHNHFPKSEECLEVLIIEGLGKRVQGILDRLRKSKSVRYIQFVKA